MSEFCVIIYSVISNLGLRVKCKSLRWKVRLTFLLLFEMTLFGIYILTSEGNPMKETFVSKKADLLMALKFRLDYRDHVQ